MLTPFLKEKTPIAIAHRGGEGKGSENTLEAFSYAISLGYRYIETDIHATKDGKVVLFHDESLERLTDVRGLVKNFTYSELEKFKICGKYKIPTLEEAIVSWSDVFFNIDCKSDNVTLPLIKILNGNPKLLNRVCIGSFSGQRLNFIRNNLGSKIITSCGPQEVIKIKLSSLGLKYPSIKAHCIQIPLYYYGMPVLDKNLIKKSHELGLKVHVWTINKKSEMHKMLDLGVDGIISDKIDILKSVYKERKIW